MPLKVEEKWKRKQDFGKGKKNHSGKKFRGKGNSWNKGKSSDNSSKAPDQGDKENSDYNSRGNYRGRRPFNRGKTNAGRGNGPLKFFYCNKKGHQVGRCPEERNNKNQGERRATFVQEDKKEDNANARELEPEEGACLMMSQVFLQVPQTQEPSQRKNLFRTKIKCQGKVCNVLIDSS